jgi:hypothetical protein
MRDNFFYNLYIILKEERTFGGYNAWIISYPSKILEVPDFSHISYLKDHPKIFGISRSDLTTLTQEELYMKAFNNGALRITINQEPKATYGISSIRKNMTIDGTKEVIKNNLEVLHKLAKDAGCSVIYTAIQTPLSDKEYDYNTTTIEGLYKLVEHVK